MPEMISYKVEQSREVIVTANSLTGAILIAQQAFKGKPTTEVDGKEVEVWGYVTADVRETDIQARESY